MIVLLFLVVGPTHSAEKAILVVDLYSGLPQAGVALQLIDNTQPQTLRSDGDGWIRFDDQDSKQNSFEVHVPGATFRLPNDDKSTRTPVFQLWFSGQIAVLPVVRTRSIAGKVLDANGTPISGMRIFAAQRSEDSKWLEATETSAFDFTDDEGSYRVSGLREGTYVLAALSAGTVAESASHGITYYPDARESANAWDIHVAEGNDIEGVDFRVQEGPLSSVLVKFPNVSSAIPGGSIAVWLIQQDGLPTPIQGGIVPPDGEYSFSDVPAGMYYVLAASVSTQEELDGSPGEGPLYAKAALNLAPGEQAELPLVLRRPIVAKAHLDSLGSADNICPIPEALLLRPLSVWPNSWSFPGRITDGEAVWDNLPPGAFRLENPSPKSDCDLFPSQPQASGSMFPPTVLLEADSDFRLNLAPAAGSIAGRIEGKTLQMADARIILVPMTESAPLQYATPQEGGTFTFPRLRAGQYTLMAGVLSMDKRPGAGAQPALQVLRLSLSPGENLNVIIKLDE